MPIRFIVESVILGSGSFLCRWYGPFTKEQDLNLNPVALPSVVRSEDYETSIREHPNFIHAQRGRARTLMQLGQDKEALQAFNEVLERDPGSAVSFANRGILQDRMGLYSQAIEDYDRAIKMEPRLGEGLDWFTRFVQNREEKPQTLADRLQTLRSTRNRAN